MNHQQTKWLINLTLSLILLVAIFTVGASWFFGAIVLLVYVVQWGLFKWLSKR